MYDTINVANDVMTRKTGQVVGLYFLLTSYIMETWFVWGIIPISPQVIPLYLNIRNEKVKVLSVCKLSPPTFRCGGITI
jgi:hypothetical protein